MSILLASLLLMQTPQDGPPPIQYQGDNIAPVIFVDPSQIDFLCGSSPPPYKTLACVTWQKVEGKAVPVMAVPNPCGPQWAGEGFAYIMCHELGHVNGWKHPPAK